jgi:23S rRNA (adenine2503-C2)-methyltransferase
VKILSMHGDDLLARVFVALTEDGSRIEFVESVQPPVPRDEKWVLIVSTLKGCPVRCAMCDAGGAYHGRLTAGEILEQIEFLVRRRFPDGRVPVSKLKVQFARMGEPALNEAVLEALRLLPERIAARGLMPCVSTIAPAGREAFFEELSRIKRELYPDGRFQLQFSIHSTDEAARGRLMPTRIWSLEEIGAYGRRFHAPGDRKLTLNFAPVEGLPLEPEALPRHFPPDRFLIKLTPVNPTRSARRAGLRGCIEPGNPAGNRALAERFRRAGYQTLVSIGELRENEIGSNCGMYAHAEEAVREGRVT